MEIEMNNLTHIYKSNIEQMIFNEISGTISPGEKICIVGPSGMGKTTLVNILSGLLEPTMGAVFYDSIDITKQDDSFKSKLRRENVGLVYQEFHLIDELSVMQNIRLPMELLKIPKTDQMNTVEVLLDEINMSKFKHSNIGDLSGGQQQRIAIATALANSPKVIFADEPTGNLDKENTDIIMDLLVSICDDRRTSLVISTHDPEVMKWLDKTWEITNKKIEISDNSTSHP